MTRAAAALAAIAAALVHPRPAAADPLDLSWGSEGYYRARTVYLTNLAPQASTSILDPGTGEDIFMPTIRRTSYITQRLRLMPTLSYAKLAQLNLQIDAIDDVLWGDNNGVSSAPLFATETSNQNFLGGPVKDSVTIPRAWVQFAVPVGLMRVGRQPSHWGMGLLANGGGTGNLDTLTPPPPGKPDRPAQDHFFDDDFGDNHFGSTADRILFITRPLTIARTIMKAKNKESKIIVGYAYDKIAEAPLLAAEGFSGSYRPFGQQGFISRRGGDDVNEHVFLAVYSDPDWDQVRYTDQLRGGIYTVLRTARRGSTFPSDPDLHDPANCNGQVPCNDTGSKVYIADLWYKVRYGSWYSEAEMIHIGGKTFGGVPFPSKNQIKKANINGGAARFGYLTDAYDGILELGYASGDEYLEDGTFKQRALHPDYNVGLILFEEILREQTARAFINFVSEENPEGAQGLMSRGGVINARYLQPKVRWRAGRRGLEVIGAVLMAWADKLPISGVNSFYLPLAGDAGSYYGTEVDAAFKASFSGKMHFSLETGYLLYGDALKAKLTRADGSFTVQSRIAFMW
ncbi:MAG TPA: hypothetical protein VL172_02730 [Kofleriaceae bacterium]|nr:hypothetical protein [Kofleriaceae bacterium]